MATATKPRRKYRFRDRAEAESAYFAARNAEINQLRLARALYMNGVAGQATQPTIEWGKKRGSYHFGVFDRHTCAGPRIVKVFAPKTGQEPDLQVIDPWGNELQQIEESAARWAHADPDEQALLDCIIEIRQIMGPLV